MDISMDMSGPNQLSQRITYWSAILIGVVFLYWGAEEEIRPDRFIAPTVSWGNQLLTDMSHYVWLPAVGVLLIVFGISPLITRQVQGNRVVQFGVGLVGLSLIGGGAIFLGISASDLGGIMYFSPLFIAGILLVGLMLPS
jgi:hypothetical protein